MGRLAEWHAQPARTSGGNNFWVRLLEELHCHTPTHEQLLYEGCAGIASRAVTGIISEVTSFANYRKFHDHTFGDASALLSGFKNISARFTARRFLARASNRRLLASLVFSSTAKFRRRALSRRITSILAFYLRENIIRFYEFYKCSPYEILG